MPTSVCHSAPPGKKTGSPGNESTSVCHSAPPGKKTGSPGNESTSVCHYGTSNGQRPYNSTSNGAYYDELML